MSKLILEAIVIVRSTTIAGNSVDVDDVFNVPEDVSDSTARELVRMNRAAPAERKPDGVAEAKAAKEAEAKVKDSTPLSGKSAGKGK